MHGFDTHFITNKYTYSPSMHRMTLTLLHSIYVKWKFVREPIRIEPNEICMARHKHRTVECNLFFLNLYIMEGKKWK